VVVGAAKWLGGDSLTRSAQALIGAECGREAWTWVGRIALSTVVIEEHP